MQNKLKILLLAGMVLLGYSACKKSMVGKTEACDLVFADSSFKHPKHQIYKAILEKYKKRGLPGIAVLLEDEDGVWVGSIGKADIANDIDFKPCTVSKVASITKMMFATAVFQLVEQGKVNLDDKVSKWIKADIIKHVKNSEKATLRDLLQHSSGIYDIINDGDFYLAVLNNPNKKWEAEELIRFAYDKPTSLEYVTPAKKGSYSNTNTLLLTMCIEEITGEPHAKWMNELVINKAGLSSTLYHSHDRLPSNVAQGYYDLYNNGTIVNVSNLIIGNGHGYNGIYSNVLDLHKFIKALFIDKTLVSQASLDVMQTFIEDDETGNLGVGLLQQYKAIFPNDMGIGHSGRDLGYSGDAHYFPTKNNRIFIDLVNYGTNGKTKLRQVFYDMKDEFVTELLK